MGKSEPDSYYDWQRKFSKGIENGNIPVGDYDNRLGVSRAEFKAFVNNWKKENLDERLIVVLDIETTSLRHDSGMIVEVGSCFLDLNSGKVSPIFSAVCQEEKIELDENAWVFKNSDLTIEDVRSAPCLNDFREFFQGVLDLGYPIAAYNQNFDFGWLESRKFQITQKFWDPMEKLTQIICLRGPYGNKWPSVQEAWNYLFKDEKYIEKHRALDDAIHEAKIIYKTQSILKSKARKE